MKKRTSIIDLSIFIVGTLATGCLVYIMLVLQIHREKVFRDQIIVELWEYAVLFGFLLILFFNILSIVWVSRNMILRRAAATRDVISLILGVSCIILMLGEKVMVDEIAREYRLGWETIGEWIILYGFLFVQLFYNILIFYNLFRVYWAHRKAHPRP